MLTHLQTSGRMKLSRKQTQRGLDIIVKMQEKSEQQVSVQP